MSLPTPATMPNRPRRTRIALAACLWAAATAGPALACGTDSDCSVGNRSYRLYVPSGLDVSRPTGVLVFAHGYRGSAAGQMRDASLRGLADDLGVALATLDAAGDDWDLAHRPAEPGQTEAREYGYVRDVLDDIDRRLGRDSARTVMAGFSAGGMMTWTIACGMPDAFAGFVPLSGTYWLRPPETCVRPPAAIVHIHGTQDGVVPIAGRAIGPTRQGDVAAALAMYRRFGSFAATGTTQAAGMTCAESAAPPDTGRSGGSGARGGADAIGAPGDRIGGADPGGRAGAILDYCTFDGGHSFSAARLRHGWDRIVGPDD